MKRKTKVDDVESVPYLPFFSHEALVYDFPPGWLPNLSPWVIKNQKDRREIDEADDARREMLKKEP